MSKNGDVAYHIYGRTGYSQPLEFIQVVTVSRFEKPPIPKNETWLELIAFPQSAIVQVLPRGKEQEE